MRKSDGYTKTPNSFIDDRLNDLSGPACKVYLVLARLTIGFHRKEASLSTRDISKRTGLAHSTSQIAIKELLENGLISIPYKGNIINKKPSKYSIIVPKSDTVLVPKSDT
jgi:phage replication O-like protein O